MNTLTAPLDLPHHISGVIPMTFEGRDCLVVDSMDVSSDKINTNNTNNNIVSVKNTSATKKKIKDGKIRLKKKVVKASSPSSVSKNKKIKNKKLVIKTLHHGIVATTAAVSTTTATMNTDQVHIQSGHQLLEHHHQQPQQPQANRTIPFLRRLVDMLSENPDAICFQSGQALQEDNSDNNNNNPSSLASGGEVPLPSSSSSSGFTLGKIIVKDRITVENDILPKYFNHRSFASLRRQLNYFNFVREGKGRQRGATYVNEDVVVLEDILNLRRRTTPLSSQCAPQGDTTGILPGVTKMVPQAIVTPSTTKPLNKKIVSDLQFSSIPVLSSSLSSSSSTSEPMTTAPTTSKKSRKSTPGKNGTMLSKNKLNHAVMKMIKSKKTAMVQPAVVSPGKSALLSVVKESQSSDSATRLNSGHPPEPKVTLDLTLPVEQVVDGFSHQQSSWSRLVSIQSLDALDAASGGGSNDRHSSSDSSSDTTVDQLSSLSSSTSSEQELHEVLEGCQMLLSLSRGGWTI